MSLIRYRGPLVSLRGAVGRLLPDGRASLRGAAREVPASELARPLYWIKADGAWSGPFQSWEGACAWLASLLTIWGDPIAADEAERAVASPDGLTLYVSGCRVRVLPGGERAPVDAA